MLQRKCQAFHLFEKKKLFSHMLKILNYEGSWENKQLPGENQRDSIG